MEIADGSAHRLNYRRDFRAKDALAGSLVFRGNPKRRGKCIACYVARFVLCARAVQLFLGFVDSGIRRSLPRKIQMKLSPKRPSPVELYRASADWPAALRFSHARLVDPKAAE